MGTQPPLSLENLSDVTRLKSVKDISERTNIPEDLILEYVDAGIMPHYRVLGQPLFKLTHAKQWVLENLVTVHDGEDVPYDIRILVEPPKSTAHPSCLDQVPGLRDVTGLAFYGSGVYILTYIGEIVYVGQTTSSVASRLACHVQEKTFDKAFFLSVPRGRLNAVEGALIRQFQPKYNGKSSNGKMICPSESSVPMCDAEVLVKYNISGTA